MKRIASLIVPPKLTLYMKRNTKEPERVPSSVVLHIFLPMKQQAVSLSVVLSHLSPCEQSRLLGPNLVIELRRRSRLGNSTLENPNFERFGEKSKSTADIDEEEHPKRGGAMMTPSKSDGGGLSPERGCRSSLPLLCGGVSIRRSQNEARKRGGPPPLTSHQPRQGRRYLFLGRGSRASPPSLHPPSAWAPKFTFA
ncbi:hypothetical protein Scep_029973 [Stephania cephalantha]|uniref:Uncharacterized protein n=1 Tax=Stephania cephalantha TaxID=152367 RepID=A0AAP0HG41_9MAGN